MNKQTNKWVTLLLVVAMLIGVTPVFEETAWAAEGTIRATVQIINKSSYRNRWQYPKGDAAMFIGTSYLDAEMTLLDKDQNDIETKNGKDGATIFSGLEDGTYYVRLELLENENYAPLVPLRGVVNGGTNFMKYEWEKISDPIVIKNGVTKIDGANGDTIRWMLEYEAFGLKLTTEIGTFSNETNSKEKVIFEGWNDYFEYKPDEYGKYAYLNTHNGIYWGDAIEDYDGLDTLPIPTLSDEEEAFGYKFSGWKQQGSDKLLSMHDAVSLVVKEDIVLEAVFTHPTHTVTFRTDATKGEFEGGGSETTLNIEGNASTLKKLTKPGTTLDPDHYDLPKITAKEGYQFIGWYTDLTTNVVPNEEIIATPITGNRVYYAKYSKEGDVPPVMEDVAVQFIIGENGKQTDTTALNQTISYGASAVSPKVSPNNGYTFLGWTIDGGYGTIYPETAINNMKITENTTFRAHYQKINYSGGGGGGTVIYYVLDFEENGGSRIAPLTVLSGTNVDVTGYVPVRAGYTFLGWYAEPTLKTPVEKVKMSNNKIVYADWKKNGDTDDKDSKPGMDTGKETADVPAELNGEYHFDYIVGYPDGYVYPKKNITRAEVAMIFFRLLQDDVRDTYYTKVNHFTDMQADMWHNTAVSTMANMGILKGYKDGSFRPNGAITRAEFAAIAARFDKRISDGITPFSDIYGHWAQFEIIKAAENGWVAGYPNGTFLPDTKITRAEAMAMINRVLKRNPREPEDLLEHMIRWPDNLDTSKWYYLDVQEATNSHDYERETKSTEKWTKIQPSKDWMVLER